VVHAFGDGATCKALGGCQVLKAVPGDEGATWHLASANGQGTARIELVVRPDGSRISAVDVSGDPSGRLAALVLEDLHASSTSNDDRSTLAWYMREHLETGAIEHATPLCASGVCVSAGRALGKPIARLGFDPAIETDARAMRRAAAAARRATTLEARRAAEKAERHERRRASRPSAERPTTDASPSASRRTCCKHCTKGIPCGNTCIAANRACHVGPGCAC
jgi:hypothetical protein